MFLEFLQTGFFVFGLLVLGVLGLVGFLLLSLNGLSKNPLTSTQTLVGDGTRLVFSYNFQV